jgi:hypothetical protein
MGMGLIDGGFNRDFSIKGLGLIATCFMSIFVFYRVSVVYMEVCVR